MANISRKKEEKNKRKKTLGEKILNKLGLKKERRGRPKKRKGFTLIELLAVIVILGLLMAIAIPSVTRYITTSRKKTLTTTIGNYTSALVNEVNNLDYTFTKTNTVYAVPIECISLERGGNNPLGEWHQANDKYFAYVLVQYDDENSSYRYAFTFKDSSGYGLYPTDQDKLSRNDKNIKTGLSLKRPQTGKITTLTAIENWSKSGFIVNDETEIIVLQAESEGKVGDGITTCTLHQKGSNYAQVEEEKNLTLANLIKKNNEIITDLPNLTAPSSNSNEKSGLYVSYDTNSGNATYYFRGNVDNNNIKFANQNWKIVRINEDGTVRLILNNTIENNTNQPSQSNKNYLDMYYSNSDYIKPIIEQWYQNNIEAKGYNQFVATTMFCEEAKVKYVDNNDGVNANMQFYENYNPTFKCETDFNNKGIINSKVGLMSYDEIMFAGAIPYQDNTNYYLSDTNYFWTMTPAGYNGLKYIGWLFYSGGLVQEYYVYFNNSLRPVINLNADLIATGTGTTSNPYVLKIN